MIKRPTLNTTIFIMSWFIITNILYHLPKLVERIYLKLDGVNLLGLCVSIFLAYLLAVIFTAFVEKIND